MAGRSGLQVAREEPVWNAERCDPGQFESTGHDDKDSKSRVLESVSVPFVTVSEKVPARRIFAGVEIRHFSIQSRLPRVDALAPGSLCRHIRVEGQFAVFLSGP